MVEREAMKATRKGRCCWNVWILSRRGLKPYALLAPLRRTEGNIFLSEK
jgi:hypothetical protein